MTNKPKLVQATGLFETPLFVFQVDNHAELNQKIHDEAQTIRANSPGMVRSNQRGWHSDSDLFRRSEPALKQISQIIVNCARAVIVRTSQKKPTQLRCEGWININPKGGYNVPHDHSGYLWSGTYYVRVPTVEGSRSGNIEFIDPRNNVSANAQGTFKTKHRINPRDGMLIIFPGYLNHWVYPNEQDEDRMTIAFNVNLPLPSPESPGSPQPKAD